jgi:hypothetical protein
MDDPVDCPTTDACFPNECVNGVCHITPIICNDPDNLCDHSICDKGTCVYDIVTCPDPGACFDLDNSYAGGCNPATGTCVVTKRVCQPQACADVACSTDVDDCVELPTEGCTPGCLCVDKSTVCVKQRCLPDSDVCGPPVTVDCESMRPDYCQIAAPCDETNGCVYTPNDCSTVAPIDACHTVELDPSNPECCIQKEISCDGGNLCKSYSCDPTATGDPCVETDLCLQDPNDKCKLPTCTATGCEIVQTICEPINACYGAYCDPTTGECLFPAVVCDDSDTCTTDSCDTTTGECIFTDIVCNDNDVCTTDACSAGDCAFNREECDDNIACTVDICDPKTGCSYTPNDEVCKSADPCIVSTCDPKVGCVEKPATCTSEGLWCEHPVCRSYEGCVTESRPCGENSTATCVYFSCDEDKDECTEEALVCGAAIDTTLVLSSVLGTAALAGIVVAVVIVAAGVGGGTAFAYYQGGIGGGASTTANNPLYVDDGTKQDNPLYAPQ